jgi:hypothetical protein
LQFGNFRDFPENFRKFQKIWEIPKLTLSRETQKLGGHATLERTLTRLEIFFPKRVRLSGFYLRGKKSRLQPIWENWGKLGKIGGNWEKLGEIGKNWEFGNFPQNFRKL